MPNMAYAFIMGHLGRDPETKAIPSGDTVTEFSVAVNTGKRPKQGEPEKPPLWVKVSVWGKRGEVCQQYLHKGDPVLVQGRFEVETYQDKGGAMKVQVKVRADDFQFLKGRDEAAPMATGGGYVAPVPPVVDAADDLLF